MNIKLNNSELEEYARELFKVAVASYADAEDSVVEAFVKKVVEKHTVPLSIMGHSINDGTFLVKVPQGGPFGVKTPQQQLRTLITEAQMLQAFVAEQRI